MLSYRFIMVLFFIVFTWFAFTPVAHSGSMSELNVDDFEGKTTSTETSSVKSPFTPARTSLQDLVTEDLYLTGVAIGLTGKYALISGHVLQEGDMIASMKVRSIYKDRVILQLLDKVHTLYLEGGL